MEFENLEIGSKTEQLDPAKCKILEYSEKSVTFQKGDKQETNVKLVLRVKHPTGTEIEISQAKIEKHNGKLVVVGLWLNKTKDDKIPYNSAIAHLLRHMRVTRISELINREIETTEDDGYLVAKCY